MKTTTFKTRGNWFFKLPLLLFGLSLCLQNFASTGEVQGRVVSWSNFNNMQFEITRIAYASHWGDPPYGDTVSTSGFDKSVHIVDGMLSNWETVKHALSEGTDFYLYNNRGINQMFSIQTTPQIVHGEIIHTDIENNQLTVRYVLTAASRVEHNPDQPGYIDSTVTFDVSSVIKHEGVDMDAANAIQVGKFARIYNERKQTVLAFTPEAIKQDPWQPYSLKYDNYNKAFVQHGFFKGYFNSSLYFTEYRNEEWINSYREGITSRKNVIGIDLIMDIDEYPIVRPGDRVVLVPYMSPGTGLNSRRVFTRASDDNSVEGYIVNINGNNITLEVITCPTGEMADLDTAYMEITLEDEALYNLNGIRDTTQAASIQTGHYVRILDAWSGAVLVRDFDMEKVTLNEQPQVKPYFIINQMIAPGGEIVEPLGYFFHPDSLSCKENETVRITAYAMELRDVPFQIQWYKNGEKIPGAQELYYDRIATLDDHGAEFTCVATNAYGIATAPGIILTVEADTAELLVDRAAVADKNSIQLFFNKKIEKTSAEDINNYNIDQGITIESITMIGDMQSVLIKTSELAAGSLYDLSVANVNDLAEVPNQLSDTILQVGFQEGFRYLKYQSLSTSGTNPHLRWLRFFADGVAYGEGKTYFGIEGISDEDAFDIFHDPNTISIGAPKGAIVDLGSGNEILPDSLLIRHRRGSIYSWKIEGSNNMEIWTLLYDGTDDMLTSDGEEYIEDVRYMDPSSINQEDMFPTVDTQSIDFPQIPTRDISESPIALTGSASSGLPVSYHVLAGPAVESDGQLTLTDTGTVWIRATQEGNDEYYAAYPVEQTFKVSSDEPLDQTIDFETISSPYTVSSVPANIILSATATSDLPVSFSVTSGDATVSGNTLTVNSADSIEVVASQSGNAIYNAAPEVSQTFIVEVVSELATSNEDATSIYPNPTKGRVFISNDMQMPVKVYNAIGELVKSCTDCHVVDLSTLPEGLYFIELNNSIAKVIKQ